MGQQANTLSTPMTRLFAHEGVVQMAQSPGNLAKLATLDAATELAIDMGAEKVAEDTLVEGALRLNTYRVRILYILVFHVLLAIDERILVAQLVETCIRVTPTLWNTAYIPYSMEHLQYT